MRKIVFGAVLILFAGALTSCASFQSNQMTSAERTELEVVGTVSARWVSSTLASNTSLENRAISELRRAAQRQGHRGNIDIMNINVSSSFHFLSIFYGLFQSVTASGDVVLHSTEAGRNRAFGQTVEGALERAAEEVVENFTARSRIAIVYMTAEDRSQTDFITGELEHILRRRGFILVDRSQLDRIRAEQLLGISGEVDDNTAARIGNLAGASVVITGGVDGEGNLRRLRLRALDTSNGQVVGKASERL